MEHRAVIIAIVAGSIFISGCIAGSILYITGDLHSLYNGIAHPGRNDDVKMTKSNHSKRQEEMMQFNNEMLKDIEALKKS